MSNPLCASVRHWLAAGSAPPPPDLAAHVAGCPHCRGALAVTLAALDAPPPPADVGCAACDDALPAYLELERAEGASAVARRHPGLFWHLWTCSDCAESARLIGLLLDAEAAGAIPAPPRRPRPAPPLPPIRLARSALSALLGPRLSLGAAWSDGPETLLLGQRDLGGWRVSIVAHQQGAGSWELELEVEPPVHGTVTVTLGDLTLRTTLAEGEVARLGPLPAAILAAPDGPDLTVSIEPD